ncbi:MAG: hypothetical protein ABIJ56_16595 [Pseudomonadota bacterium]
MSKIAHNTNRAVAPQKAIHSYMEIVPIDYVKINRESIGERFFSPQENRLLSSRHVQTTAGFLALKKALVQCFRALSGGVEYGEKDFVLAHGDKGGPKIEKIPDVPGMDAKSLSANPHGSVSHTKTAACGLAVFQEVGRG